MLPDQPEEVLDNISTEESGDEDRDIYIVEEMESSDTNGEVGNMNDAAAPRSAKLEALHVRRMEAEAVVNEVKNMVDEDYKQHQQSLITIGENLITLVNNYTETSLIELEAARNQLVDGLNKKMAEFLELNKFAQDEIERQNFVGHGLQDTIRQLGLRF